MVIVSESINDPRSLRAGIFGICFIVLDRRFPEKLTQPECKQKYCIKFAQKFISERLRADGTQNRSDDAAGDKS